ncbi:MAG: hypothetical protein JNL74_21355, partial [Fibrobacteres bacterium]|nr:hypothetical protein [Fibrobacterota bacterium]
MKKFLKISLILASALFSLEFTQNPTMVKTGSSEWKIDFTLDSYTDVEVSIVNKSSKTCVRHLAAGVLGASAPAPLVRSSLAQTLTWDGLDDYRNPVPSPDSMTVRVRAGMGVRLDKSVGGDPYLWGGMTDPIAPYFFGMTKGSNGTVYLCFQPTQIASNVVRQYSAKGEYIKTVFPIPGGQNGANYTGWGLNFLSSTDYTPKTKDYYGPLMSNSPIGTLGCRPDFLPAPNEGQLGVFDESQNKIWVMNEDGTCDASTAAASKTFMLSPAVRGGFGYGIAGPRFFAWPRDRSYFLMAGICNTFGADTGFFRDGRIFKVDAATQTATIFYDLGSAQTGNSLRQTYIHGIAIDDAGYVFASDRLNNRILIINKDGALVKSIPALPAPDDIEYNSTDGAIYATGRTAAAGVLLYKVNNWRTDTVLSIKKNVVMGGSATSYLSAGWYDRTYLTTVNTDEGVIVWLAYRAGGITLYKENGGTFIEYKNFRSLTQKGNPTIKRLAVDPKTEHTYVVNSGSQMHKVTDWNSPTFVPCSTKAISGAKSALVAYEMAIDAKNSLFYIRQKGNSGGFEGDVNRFTLAQYPSPAPFAKLGTVVAIDSYCVRGTMSV